MAAELAELAGPRVAAASVVVSSRAPSAAERERAFELHTTETPCFVFLLHPPLSKTCFLVRIARVALVIVLVGAYLYLQKKKKGNEGNTLSPVA
jgi:hypothetical protein